MFLNQSNAQRRKEGRSGSISFVHPTNDLCFVFTHLWGFQPVEGVKSFNVCMKEPANSSTVATRQYLQLYSDGRLKINMNTFRIHCCSLFHSRGQTCKPLMFFFHSTFVAIVVRFFLLLAKFKEMRRAKVLDVPFTWFEMCLQEHALCSSI